MTPQFWLWLGFAGMAAGAAVILFLAKRRTATEEADGIIHGIVPIIAACSYFAMATGQGSLVLPAGPDAAEAARQFYFARYIDWVFTTPLQLLDLAGLAGASSETTFILITLDVLMIISGLIGAGKSTLAKSLADRLQLPVHYEPVADNEYLEDFYGDIKKYSFAMQVYLLNRRFQQQ